MLYKSCKSWTLNAVISTKEKNITCGCLLRSKSSPLLGKIRDHNMKIFELQKKDKGSVFFPNLISSQVADSAPTYFGSVAPKSISNEKSDQEKENIY